MKFRWPWQRRTAPTRPNPTARRGEGDTEPPPERGWFGSSVDLHDGLNVVEDADVTIPDELGPPERSRKRG
jgi:hypothetical protein